MTIQKYRNKKTVVDGIAFQSRKEAKRYQELLLLEKAGVIQSLRRQEKFVLIPSQYVTVGYTKTGKPKEKCVERECSYIADFVYLENGKMVVEDTKGFRTTDYIIKRKLMLWKYKIRINEI